MNKKTAPYHRLTREEAAAVLIQALRGLPIPQLPRGVKRRNGWCGIIADIASLDDATIKTYAYRGRKLFTFKT